MSAAVITTAQALCAPIPLEQVLRYLGCRPSNAPEEVRQLAARAAEAVQRAATCRACWCRLPVTISDEHRVWLGPLQFDSRNLARNLAGCQEAFLFGATIGAGPERLILAGRRLSAADALAADAAGTAAVEQWCDEINARLEALAAQEKRYLRPRYSAGYGDFSIDAQPELVQLLDLPRKIGVTVTETKMLLPSKSVTAVVGISATPANCHASGCLSCEQADCPYRA